MDSQRNTSVRLTLDVTYETHGEDPQHLKDMLTSNIQQAIGHGALTGETAAEVDHHDLRSLIVEPGVAAMSDQAAFLRALALRWKARRETQELKPGTVKHVTRQFEFFTGALSAAEALGHSFNPMVLVLLNGSDAVRVFAGDRPEKEGEAATA